jgi:hypothetical protein
MVSTPSGRRPRADAADVFIYIELVKLFTSISVLSVVQVSPDQVMPSKTRAGRLLTRPWSPKANAEVI